MSLMFIASTRPHTCISSGCEGYRLVLRRLHVASYTYGHEMRWRHESAVTVTRSQGIQRRLRHIHVKRPAILLPRRFVPECHYSLQKYNTWSLVCRYQFQPKCPNRILYSTTCRHSRTLQSQCAPPSATQTPSHNLRAKHGLTGQRQNLDLKNGRL